MRWAEEVECIEEKRNSYWVLVRKPVARRPLRGVKSGWEVKEVGLKTGKMAAA